MKGGILMNSIIDDLYYGKIRPWEKTMSVEGEYRKSVADLTSAERKLLSLLDGELKDLLEKLIKAQSDIVESYCREYYTEGLKFGIRLMAAVYEDESENFKSDVE